MANYMHSADIKGYEAEGDVLYEVYWNRPKEKKWVSIDHYNACNDEREQYENRLIELGDIVREKTPEELAKEQSDKLDKILAIVERQDQRITKLENSKDTL